MLMQNLTNRPIIPLDPVFLTLPPHFAVHVCHCSKTKRPQTFTQLPLTEGQTILILCACIIQGCTALNTITNTQNHDREQGKK